MGYTEENSTEETTTTETTQSPPDQYKPSNNAFKRIKKMQDKYMDMFQQQRLDNTRLKKHETNVFKSFKKQVGNELYASIKASSMVTNPAVLNEDGTEKTPSETILDKSLFMRQLQLAVVVLRDGRIKDGKRSKTTGRGSDRAMQNSSVDAVKQAIGARLEADRTKESTEAGT